MMVRNRKTPVNGRKLTTSGSSTRIVYPEGVSDYPGYSFTENPVTASIGRSTAGRASFNSPPAMQQQAWTSQPDLSTTYEHQADNPQQRLPRRPVSWPTMNGYMPAHMNPQSSYQFGMSPAAPLLTPQTSSQGSNSQGSNESSNDPPQTSSRKFQLLAAERDHYKTIAENSVPLREYQKVIAECNHYKITNEKLGIAINQKDAELAAVRQKAINAETQAGIFLNLLHRGQPPLRATHEIVNSAGYSAIANAIAPSTYESPYGPPATAGKSAQTLIRKAQSPPDVNPAKRIKINDSRTLTVRPAQISNIEPAKAANQDHVSQSEPSNSILSQSEPSNSIQALDHVESVAQTQSQPVPQAQTLDQEFPDFLDSEVFPAYEMPDDIGWGLGMDGLDDFNTTGIWNPEIDYELASEVEEALANSATNQ